MFSEVVVVCWDYNIYGLSSVVNKATGYTQYSRHFAVLHEMNKVWTFQLVLCADDWDCVMVDAVQALEVAVAVEWAEVGFGVFFCKPLVISHSCGSSPMFTEEDSGGHPPPRVISW